MYNTNETMQFSTAIVCVNDMFNEVLGGMSSEEITALTKMDLADPNDLMGLGNEATYATDALSVHQSGVSPKKKKNTENKSTTLKKMMSECLDGAVNTPMKDNYHKEVRKDGASFPVVTVSPDSQIQMSTNGSAITFKKDAEIPSQSTCPNSGRVHMSTKEITREGDIAKNNDISCKNKIFYGALSEDEEEDELYNQLLAEAVKVNNDHRNEKRTERNILAERHYYSSSAPNGVDLSAYSSLCKKGYSNDRFSFQDLVLCVLGPDAHRVNSDPGDILKALALVKSVDLSDRNVIDTDDIICLDSVTHLYLQHNQIETSEHLGGLSVLPHLTVLVLSHNNITSIECFSDIGCNGNLMLLDLSYNKIEKLDIENHFSDGLRRSLQDLRLVGNPCAPRYLMGCNGCPVPSKTSLTEYVEEEDVAYIKIYRSVILQGCTKLRSLDGTRITNRIRRGLGIETENGESHFDEFNNCEHDGSSCENMDCEKMEQTDSDDADDHISPSLFLLKPSKRDLIAARYGGRVSDMNPILSSSSTSSTCIDENDTVHNDSGVLDSDDDSSCTTNKNNNDKERYRDRQKHNANVKSLSSQQFYHDALLHEYLVCSSTMSDERNEKTKICKRGLISSSDEVIPNEGASFNAYDVCITEDLSRISLLPSVGDTKRKRRGELSKQLVLAHQCRGAQARVMLDDIWDRAFSGVRKSRYDAMIRKNVRRKEGFWDSSLNDADYSQKRATTPNDINVLSNQSYDSNHSQAYLQALDILKRDAKCNNLGILRSSECI